MTRVLVAVLRAYRVVVSPLYGQRCRYYPTCSAYALGAVETHGAVRGTWLAIRRLGRCHPWSAGGVDHVPPRTSYRWWGVVDGMDAVRPSDPDSPNPAPSAHAGVSLTDTTVLRGA